jgi:hypothetical protein
MKNLYKIIALATLITTTLYLSAQTGKIKKGDKYFSEYSYNKAIEKYESLTQKNN